MTNDVFSGGKMQRLFRYGDAAEPHPVRWGVLLSVILLGWALFWTLLPCCVLDNDFIDVLENIVWGSHPQWGYDKNPYAGAQFGYWIWRLSGGAFFSSFLASQLCVCIGVFCVYLTAIRFLPRRTAFLGVIVLLSLTFYGIKAVELCDDVMELALWPATMLLTYLGVRGREKYRPLCWLGAGLCAGLSLMVKYFAPAMFLAVAIPLVFTAEGRRVFRTFSFWLSAVPFLLLVLPNVFWLHEYRYEPLFYAAERASLLEEGVPWTDHFAKPLKALNRAAGVFGVGAFLFALFFPLRKPAGDRPSLSSFDKVFVWSCCWTPFCAALLFSAVTGGSINYSWVVPCFPFFGIWLFAVWMPRISPLRARIFTVVVLLHGIGFGAIFAVRSLEVQGYRKDGCDYENFPGRAMTEAVSSLWHTVSERPLPYVIGDRTAACNTAVYSPAHPEAFFGASVDHSQWIRPEDVLRRGGVIVTDLSSKSGRRRMNKYWTESVPEAQHGPERKVLLERAVPQWYRNLRGTPPCGEFLLQVILSAE